MRADGRGNWLWFGTLALCVAVALFFGQRREWHNLAMYGMIHADAQGYYGYLVAAFIERSFDWGQVISSYADVYFGGTSADFTVMTDHGRVNKYYAGTAVLMLPFFALSCLAAWVLGFPVDGYSIPFHVGMMLCALFYVIAGLALLGRWLRGRGFSYVVISAAAAGVFLGTGLFYYTVMEPAMSHAYSFFLFCAFIPAADRAMQRVDTRSLTLLGAFVALIALVRPTNVVIILAMPFIAGGFSSFISFLKELFQKKKQLMTAFSLAVLIVGIQPLMYLLQVGKPLVWSYSGEGFNFLDPQIVNVLFSYQKGLFVYYPWTLLAALGLIAMLLTDTARAVWLVVFLSVSVYVVSSWWNWYYGSSFGMRAMIDHLPFFMVMMAHLLRTVPTAVRSFLIPLSLLAVPLNFIQTYQYNKFILHWDGMDRDRYWKVFLRTTPNFEGIFYRTESGPLFNEADVERVHVLATDLEELGEQWGAQGRTDVRAFSGQWSSLIGKDNPYGPTIGVPWTEVGMEEGKRFLRISMMVWADKAFTDLQLACSFNRGEHHYGHIYFDLTMQLTEARQWVEVTHIAEVAAPESTADIWILYPYTTGAKDIFVDDIRYEVLTVKD
jgi:hypothetical protein